MSTAGTSHPDATESDVVVDVVVVGMGAAGCAAAVAAHDAGADVLILEKDDVDSAGGNSRVSGGAWLGHDDPEGIATYLRALSGDRAVPEPVVEAWAHGTRGISDWMTSLGVTVVPLRHFPVEYPELPAATPTTTCAASTAGWVTSGSTARWRRSWASAASRCGTVRPRPSW